MQLTIDGTQHTLQPIATLRQTAELSPDFGVQLFEPGLAPNHSFWQASQTLNQIGQKVVGAIPFHVPVGQITDQPNLLADLFERELVAQAAGLDIARDELENTAMTFRNVLESACYKLFELYYVHKDLTQVKAQFDMQEIYQGVLDGSLFLATQQHAYTTPAGDTWRVQLIYTLYGPTGLFIERPAGPKLVLDPETIFPAYTFLEQLCHRSGSSLAQALG